MKILFAHNYYVSSTPSGENLVYDLERRTLQATAGWSVIEYCKSNKNLEKSSAFKLGSVALGVPWNHTTYKEVKQLIQQHRPDVLHVHNLHPQLSPSIFYAAQGTGTATVVTLHNFRVACANGLALRDGHPCTRCIDERSVLPAIRYRCYRSSMSATVPIAASIALHRAIGTWATQLDALISLTEFQ